MQCMPIPCVCLRIFLFCCRTFVFRNRRYLYARVAQTMCWKIKVRQSDPNNRNNNSSSKKKSVYVTRAVWRLMKYKLLVELRIEITYRKNETPYEGGMTTFNIHKPCAPLLHHCTTHSPMLAFSISFSLLLRSCLALYDPIRAYFGMCKKCYDVIGVFVYGRTIFAHVCVSLSHKCACIAAQNVEPNWKFVHCRMHTVTNGSSSNSSSSNGHQQTFSIGMFTGVYEFIVIVPCKQCTDVMCATSQTTAQPICSRCRNTRLSWCLDNAAVPFERARLCVFVCVNVRD